MTYLFSILGILIATEALFRFVYRKRHGRNYHVALKFRWNDSHVVTHPFLSFSYRRNHVISKNQTLPYDLHPNRYHSFKNPLRLNNYGHFGPDFHLGKTPGTLRIACLGASTTANNISDGVRDYCYPSILSGLLNEGLHPFGLKAEVLNCGIGGWVSADILINFCLNIVHLRPDYVILYHGFNDLHLGLMPEFKTDYSHGRRNLGEVVHLIKRAYRLPKIRFWTSYEWLKDRLLGTGNIRNDVLSMITSRKPDYKMAFQGLDAQQENFRSLLAICSRHGTRPVLSSYAIYPHGESSVLTRMAEGVDLENAKMLDLAREFEAIHVDQASLIPKTPGNFVDAIHFTPEGMTLLAANFSRAILDDVKADRPC